MEDPGLRLIIYQLALVGVSLLLSAAGSIHALLRKRDSRSALGWIVVCIALPIAGALLYFLFGINRVHTRARKLRAQIQKHTDASRSLAHAAPFSDPAWRHSMATTFTAGNDVAPLFGQRVAYTSMLEAISGATHTVLLSSYIFRADDAGQAFVDALTAAATRGANVYVLIDGVGEFYSLRRVSRPLRAAGVRVARYLPPRLIPPSLHINLRNHRKILVVDGAVAFTGGMNIGGEEFHQTIDHNDAQDIQFRLLGPVVTRISDVFWSDWEFATGRCPALPVTNIASQAGAAQCRVVIDGPDENLDSLALCLLSAVSRGHRRVTIMTPYFVPNRELIGGLKAAAVSGVSVSVILPVRSNLPFVDWATRKLLWELLQVGVAVYFLPPPFRHTKLLLVDDDYVMLGSANWDSRSLRLNFEIGVEVRDARLCAQLRGHCAHALSIAHRTSLDEMDARNVLIKVRDALAWLGSPYL